MGRNLQGVGIYKTFDLECFYGLDGPRKLEDHDRIPCAVHDRLVLSAP